MCAGFSFSQWKPRWPAAYGATSDFAISALVAGGERPLEEALGLFRVAGDDPGQERLRRDEPLSRSTRSAYGSATRAGPPPRGRAGRRRTSESGSSRRAASTSLLRPEAAHRLLERPRPPVRPQRERLALEHGLSHRQRPRPLHHLGHARGDVLQLAGEDAHLVARTVDLQARAVDLVLEGRLARAARAPPRASPAGLASIGATGDRSRSEKRARPAAPSSRAARASSPTLPAYIAARRTSAGAAPRPSRSPRPRGLRAHPGAPRPISSSTSSRRPASSVRSKTARSAAAALAPSRRPSRPRRPTSACVHVARASAAFRPRVRHGSAGSRVRQPRPMRPCGSDPVR